MRRHNFTFHENLLLKTLMISFLPLLVVSCSHCRNDDAPGPPPPFEFLLKDAESNSNIIKNSAGEGIYPADQIRFLDINKDQVSMFDITEDGIIIYTIPEFVNNKEARFSYYIELEPGVQYEFELAHYYRSSECFGYLLDRIEMVINDDLFILGPNSPVEIYLTF